MSDATVLLASPVVAAAGGLWSFIAVFQWRGVWRVLACVPIAAFLAYVAVVLVPDWLDDPTSHNLWPFEAGFWLWPSLPYMAILAAIRRGRLR